MAPKAKTPGSKGHIPDSVMKARYAGGRLAAIQALYAMEQTGMGAKAIIRDFLDDRLGYGPDEKPVEEADPDIFKAVVLGVAENLMEIDQKLSERLAKGWKLQRLNGSTRAILRGGAYELLFNTDVSDATTIDEYTSLAADFDLEGDKDQPPSEDRRFVNAVLDRLANDLIIERASFLKADT